MKTIPSYISAEKVQENSDMTVLVRLLKEAYLNKIDCIDVPQRTSIVRPGHFTAFDIMPAYSEDDKLFITKIGAVIPKEGINQVSVNTSLVAFSAESGEIIGIFDGDAITKLKCAAVTALVTDYCSDPNAKVLGLVGTGAQAQRQIDGVFAVRDIEEIRIYSRNQERVRNFIEENKKRYANINFIACNSSDEVTIGAQIISTATTSVDPILSVGVFQVENVHVNSVGNHLEDTREIPLEILENSLLVVEDRKTAILEAGDVHEKAMDIKELVKMNPVELQNQRTVFSSTGHAFLDLVAVAYLVDMLNLKNK